MAKKQMGLGRGLDELFGSMENETASEVGLSLNINLIEPSRAQPRKCFDGEALDALAESIRLHGVITPITVRKIDEDRYRIVAGERRYRAARMAGLESLPVHIVEADELQAMEMAMVENLQRTDLNPIETAEGLKTLIERYGTGQEEAARRVGMSRPAVANALRLLELPETVQELVADGILTAGHGRALAGLSDASLILDCAQKAVALDLSVRQTEALVQRMKKGPEKPKGDGVNYAAELSKDLTESLGRMVQVKMKSGKSGSVVLSFSSLDELDEVIDRLKKTFRPE